MPRDPVRATGLQPQSLWRVPTAAVSWTNRVLAAIPVESPYCSCKLD